VSRKALLKRVPKRVEINGEPVFVRSLTLRESLRFDEMTKTDETGSLRYIVRIAVVDEEGSPLFADGDAEIDDIPVDVVREIGEAIKKVSSGGSVEKAAKN
jgi:hypothetical protein